MAYKVRFVEPNVHYQRMKAEIDGTIQDVLARGDLIYRKDLKQFEQNLADFVGTRYAVGLNSGFHALHLSLIAAGLGPGDEVIVPAHTFVASVSAIVLVGATPVLVDVTEDYNMDMDAMERAITPKTKAVMPVHLNGRICDMERLMAVAAKHNLIVIEDAAQALGATFKGKKAGSFGLTGCFSFYPFKVLGALGDAGIVTTDDEEVAMKIARLRYNGEDRETGEYHYHGFTCLLDNLQAAVLDVKLRYLPQWLARRRQVAEMYRVGLSNIGDLRLPHFAGDAYHDIYQNYVIRTPQRDALVKHLQENGIETLIHWPKPMWEHKGLELGEWHLPETEAICREVVSLPMNPEISDESIAYVIETIRRFYA
ncbi:MAG TPA: DegT/DnrJ/EryC1/StrS family aminotransferase [Anaerolineae bacterium]|nr:DegT/DnrJ/EryC1/StrS family aminotransferase [Anaerolineae bacterium]HQH37340.1 DegT/DnrJ/EryC1/StrS family aminotransferase [Anaerolineae bacterium]